MGSRRWLNAILFTRMSSLTKSVETVIHRAHFHVFINTSRRQINNFAKAAAHVLAACSQRVILIRRERTLLTAACWAKEHNSCSTCFWAAWQLPQTYWKNSSAGDFTTARLNSDSTPMVLFNTPSIAKLLLYSRVVWLVHAWLFASQYPPWLVQLMSCALSSILQAETRI